MNMEQPLHRARRVGMAGIIALSLLPMSACSTNKQTGQLVGAGGGALIGGAIGNAIGGNTTGTLVGAGLGAVGGYFIGGAIGEQLDEADRKQATAATQQVLAEPATYTPGAPPSPPPQPAQWQSDHSGNSGSAKVVSVQQTANGGECRTVHEVAYIKGQEVPQNSRYCRGTDGAWIAQT
jgi:surface antigen